MSGALPPLGAPHLLVWGEPTIAYMAVCGRAFERDGSVPGEVLRTPGGSAYATAVGVAHLGASVTLVMAQAGDADGTDAADVARSRGVSVLSLPGGVTTRRTVIVVDRDGARGMVGDPGDSFNGPWADAFPRELFELGGVFHLSLSSVLRDRTGAVRRLLLDASAKVPVSIDLGSASALTAHGADVVELLQRCAPTVVFANEDEAAALLTLTAGTGRESAALFVERHGRNPVRIYENGSFAAEVAPLAEVTVIDTTGAGDAFAAGFVASWLSGTTDAARAVVDANAYAARAVATLGTVVPL